MVKIFFDTEFFAGWDQSPIDRFFGRSGQAVIRPISVGLATESGETVYWELKGASQYAQATPWLAQNVAPHLSGEEKPRDQVAKEIIAWLDAKRNGDNVQFYASYGAYDWTLVCELLGGLMNIPDWILWTYHETTQDNLPRVARVGSEHNAVTDAATLAKAWRRKFGEVSHKKCLHPNSVRGLGGGWADQAGLDMLVCPDCGTSLGLVKGI